MKKRRRSKPAAARRDDTELLMNTANYPSRIPKTEKLTTDKSFKFNDESLTANHW